MQVHLSQGLDQTATHRSDPAAAAGACDELQKRYGTFIAEHRFHWTTHLHFRRKLGAGGQGVVFLTEKKGADGFTVPVALKIFSPERYADPEAYDEDMIRMGQVSARVARIQHEYLVGVENFLERDRIRLLVMEWIEGFDLRRLLAPSMFGILRDRVSARRWQYMNDVIATMGAAQTRFKSGVAVAIARHCLSALGALHRNGIVHGDVKPANIMLKRSGHAKIIDLGAAFEIEAPPQRLACTPGYSAVEVLEGAKPTPASDLASLGFVLVELLAGKPLFTGKERLAELIDMKRTFADRLDEFLPNDVTRNDLLMSFCSRLVAARPEERFPSAEAAELFDDGAAAFHRQLIKVDLASEYDSDIRTWIEELLDLEALLE